MHFRILNKDIDSHRLKVIAAFLVIYFVWGSTYLAIRFTLESIPPLLTVGIRFTIAGLLLCGWFYYRTGMKPTLTDWKSAFILGVTMTFIGYSCLAWAQQFIPSGLAASIVASISIWMVIIDWKIFGNQKPDKRTIIGLCMGIIGVALLTILKEEVLISNKIPGATVFIGVSIITFATIIWAYGSMYSKKIKNTIPLSFIIGLQIFIGGIILIIAGSVMGEWNSFAISQISFLSISSLMYLILIGTVIAHSAFFWLLRVKSPAMVGTYAFFNPLIALILGVVLADEILTPVILLGAGLIFSSILIINKWSFGIKKLKSIFNGNKITIIEAEKCLK